MNSVKHWPQKPLSLCLELIIDYRGKSIPKSDHGVQLITARNVRDGIVDLRHQEFIPVDLYDSWMDRGIPQEGDVLFTTEAPLGMIAPYPFAGTFALGQRLVALRANEIDLHSGYLLQFLRSPIGQNRIFTLATGSTAIGIRQSELRKIKIPLPPLAEQRKIAAILGTWDAAIDRAERLVAALKTRKKALMQRLLTGAVRFPKYQKSAGTQNTILGDIPADWRYVQIGTIARHVSAKNGTGLTLPVLSCTKYDGLVDSLQYFGRQIYSDDTSPYKIVKRHQFAYATNHIEEGSIGYQHLYDAALISPMYTVFETTDAVDDGYLYALLKTETYRRVFERSMSATVDRRGSLRWPEFSKILVPLPSRAEQQCIAELLRTSEEEIAQQTHQLELLRKQKRGLMQRLLTGEVRVAVDG